MLDYLIFYIISIEYNAVVFFVSHCIHMTMLLMKEPQSVSMPILTIKIDPLANLRNNLKPKVFICDHREVVMSNFHSENFFCFKINFMSFFFYWCKLNASINRIFIKRAICHFFKIKF